VAAGVRYALDDFKTTNPDPAHVAAIEEWARRVDLDSFVKRAVRSVDDEWPEGRLHPIPQAKVVAWFLAHEGDDPIVFIRKFSSY
jgi:hypothetical protein